jgi:hypothetical protein
VGWRNGRVVRSAQSEASAAAAQSCLVRSPLGSASSILGAIFRRIKFVLGPELRNPRKSKV